LPAAQDERPQGRTRIAQRPLKGAASGPGIAVIGVFGPTASGKTAVAEAIAARIPAELVSADSMQVYRGLPVLTNQDAGARLVGIWPLDRQGTVGEFQRLAHEAIDEIVAAGSTAIVVGGSGLWFQAALTDVALPADVPAGARARWERIYDRRGPETAHGLLQRRDRRAAAQVHPNDRKRVVRALELWQAGGTLVPEQPQLWTAELRLPTLVIGLEVGRATLAERIRARTQAMFEHGVEEEVRAAGEVIPQVLGLEAVRTLPRNEAIAELERATLRFAAYQRKWMRRIPGIVMIDADRPVGEVADAVLEVARAR
jgi:tRNA dimethylallyltransferase